MRDYSGAPGAVYEKLFCRGLDSCTGTVRMP